MQYKFRTDSIHAEVELLAKEFDNALPPQKSERAERLLVFMHNYPNAELWRALPVAKRNLLDDALKSQVRRKCARMLGEIGASAAWIGAGKIREAASALAGSLGDSHYDVQDGCICEIKRIAEARRGHDLDCVVGPVLDMLNGEVSEGIDGMEPRLAEFALAALGATTPHKPECMELLRGAKRRMIGEKLQELEGTTDKEERDQIREAWNPYVSSISRIERKWAAALKINPDADDAKNIPMRGNGTAASRNGNRRIIRIP